jgi:hypothetical protein
MMVEQANASDAVHKTKKSYLSTQMLNKGELYMNVYSRSAVALGACLAMSGTAMAQGVERPPQNDLITLRLNLRPGQKYRMTQTTRAKVTMIAPPAPGGPVQKTDTNTTSTSDINYHVLYINRDGTAQVRLTYGPVSVRSTTTVDGKPTPAAQADGDPFQALQGQAIEMQISPTGHVSKVRGMEKIWKASFSDSSTEMTPQQRREMESAVKNMFGEKFFEKIMEQSGMSLPQTPVRIGESWTQRLNLTGSMPLVANLRRTLLSRRNGALTIAENGTLSFGSPSKPVRIGDASMQTDLSGNYSGTTVLDEASGFLRSSQVTQRLGGKMTVRDKDATPPMTMRMYMLMTNTTSVKNLT